MGRGDALVGRGRRRGGTRLVTLLLLAELLCGVSTEAAPDAVRFPVTAADPVPGADGTVAGVDYTPFGAFTPRPLRKDDRIGNGDLVSSSATPGTGFVQIGDWTFTKPFRALFVDLDGEIKKIDLGAGTLVARTDVPNEVRSGGVVLNTVRTIYCVRVEASEEGSKATCVLLEGRAYVQSRRGTEGLGAGMALEWDARAGTPSDRRVTPEEMARASGVLARTDLGRARFQGIAIEDAEGVETRLAKGYVSVMTRPNEPTGYVDVSTALLGAKLVPDALVFLQKAAGKADPLDGRANARIAFTKSAAAQMRGAARDAQVLYALASDLDPAAVADDSQWSPALRRAIEDIRGAAHRKPPPDGRKPDGGDEGAGMGTHPTPMDEPFRELRAILSRLREGGHVLEADLMRAWALYVRESMRTPPLPLSTLRPALDELAKVNRLKEAVAGYENALSKEPGTSADHLGFARVLALSGDDRASSTARKALDLHGSDRRLTDEEIREARSLAR